ncbi:hypothetical protein CLOM_g17999 [Closterium sp. NIES-68]|nr:hypothetical protein CLOM_g17999 [Closterium sp. NIES-68]GJP70125.1 hypothetical protein CLOP_g1106 [Closterium sp. NIES-67]
MQAEEKQDDSSGSGSARGGQAPPPAPPLHDYKAALKLSLDFFDAQKSGDLSQTPHPPWRNSSHLTDGKEAGRDLAGGYYVDGGGVKHTGKMAFAMSMLAWSIVEYDAELDTTGFKQRAIDLLKWGADWLLKADVGRGCVVAQVGDSAAQNECWQRPEDDSAARPVYTVVGGEGPGAEVLGDLAAAFAAASHVFGEFDPGYAALLRDHASMLFTVASSTATTDDTAPPGAQPYHPSSQSSPDFHDELLWAAAWLWRTTMSDPLHQYLLKPQLASLPYSLSFTHANKSAGAAVLLASFVLGPMEEEDERTTQAYGADVIFRFQKLVEASMCSSVADAPSTTTAETLARNMPRTPGGLLWLDDSEPLHAAVQAAFLLKTYSRFLKAGAEDEGPCSGVSPRALATLARSQVDYLLGSNSQQFSYMVGFDDKYPKFVRHRGASIPSLASDPTVYTCSSGQQWLQSSSPNPNILSGVQPMFGDFIAAKGWCIMELW